MKREDVFQALSEINDRYITESVSYAPGEAAASPERIVYMKKKRVLTLVLAAVLVMALGVTAYAAFFSMNRRVPEESETFRIDWEESPTGYLEWSNAKLAVTFPDTAESREIEFRPAWLPFDLPDRLAGCVPWGGLSAYTWFSRFSAEQLADQFPDMTANQPLLIESYSMSMFNDGGALLLLYYTPENIVEEHWDELNVDVMRFHCTEHLDAVPDFDVPERTLEQDIILMSNADAGWVIRLCGEIGMDDLIKVAKNLEIRETGRTFTYDDFQDHYTFMDGGVG